MLFGSSRESSCKEQIRAYKNDTASKFCKGLDLEFVVRKIRSANTRD